MDLSMVQTLWLPRGFPRNCQYDQENEKEHQKYIKYVINYRTGAPQ